MVHHSVPVSWRCATETLILREKKQSGTKLFGYVLFKICIHILSVLIIYKTFFEILKWFLWRQWSKKRRLSENNSNLLFLICENARSSYYY